MQLQRVNTQQAEWAAIPARDRAGRIRTRAGSARCCNGRCGQYRPRTHGHALGSRRTNACGSKAHWTAAPRTPRGRPCAGSTTRRRTQSTTESPRQSPRASWCRIPGGYRAAPAAAGRSAAQTPKSCGSPSLASDSDLMIPIESRPPAHHCHKSLHYLTLVT